MKRGGAGAVSSWLALPLVAGCDIAPEAPAHPASLERRALGGVIVSATSAADAAGRRAQLHLACDGGAPSFSVTVPQPPPAPPGLRGVHGRFQLAGMAPMTVEMAWLTGRSWSIREDPDSEAMIARSLARGGSVVFSPPEGHVAGGPFTWTAEALAPHAEDARRWCLEGGTEPRPA